MPRPELPTAPHIIIRALPEEEQDDAADVVRLLHCLGGYLQRLLDAVGLMLILKKQRALIHSRLEAEKRKIETTPKHERADYNSLIKLRSEMQDFDNWQHLAARDAAMTIYHFLDILKVLIKLLPQCPTLKAFCDEQKLASAREMLDRHFPKTVPIRHSIAHSGELVANAAANAFQGRRSKGPIKVAKGGSVFIDDTLDEQTLVITRLGEMLRLDVDVDAFEKLCDVTRTAYAAYEGAERGTKSLRDNDRT